MEDITDSYCNVEPVYHATQDLQSNQTFLFDFRVIYTRVPEPDSEGEADYMSNDVETRIRNQLEEYGRDLFVGQDQEQMKDTILVILYDIGVPPYHGIVTTFTEELKSIMDSPLEKLNKIKVTINIVATMFLEDEIEIEAQYVKYSVAGASVEAIKQHLKIVTVSESVGDCVICMETIEVGLGLVGRMRCKHSFHRDCIEKWLVETGVCPLCRDVFPV